MSDPAKHTPGAWMKWKLAPESDSQERCIITTADGEEEISGIIYREEDADLIVVAVNGYLAQGSPEAVPPQAKKERSVARAGEKQNAV